MRESECPLCNLILPQTILLEITSTRVVSLSHTRAPLYEPHPPVFSESLSLLCLSSSSFSSQASLPLVSARHACQLFVKRIDKKKKKNKARSFCIPWGVSCDWHWRWASSLLVDSGQCSHTLTFKDRLISSLQVSRQTSLLHRSTVDGGELPNMLQGVNSWPEHDNRKVGRNIWCSNSYGSDLSAHCRCREMASYTNELFILLQTLWFWVPPAATCHLSANTCQYHTAQNTNLRCWILTLFLWFQRHQNVINQGGNPIDLMPDKRAGSWRGMWPGRDVAAYAKSVFSM